MVLHKLTLSNVGLFRGTQTIDLTPNGKGPIILVGGMNGAGKTTLLDAVRLCLYGKRALGNRVSRNEYDDYLSALIHRNPDAAIPLNRAAVSLEFEYSHGAETRRYRVERGWKQRDLNSQAIKEGLTVSGNDLLSNEFDTKHWEDHIDELIPIGVSQFFFFDGEDIQKLADDSSHDLYLAESIKALLGLNLVERLQSDLRIYANGLLKRDSPPPVQQEIESVEAEIALLRESITAAEAHIESLHTEIEKLEVKIARQEAHIAAEGGSYAERREQLKLRHERLQADIDRIEDDIREMCNGLYPFSLAPDLLRSLRKTLLKEMELDEWEARNRALKAQNTAVLETLASSGFWENIALSGEQIETVLTKIAPLLKTELELPSHLQGFTKLYDHSTSVYKKLLGWIDACLDEVPRKFNALIEALKAAKAERAIVESDLQKVPDKEVLRPLIEKLSVSNQELGQIRKQEKDTEKSLRSLSYQLETATRNLDNLRYTAQLGEAHLQRQERMRDVQSVLSTYTVRLTDAKIETLGSAIAEGFNQLSHKPDRITRVAIDPQTFAVTLYDTNNRPLSKDELSAGEKQIYTTALLWGLAKTSGKVLPMILDTPLGRLDSTHRQLLVERYFPYASHQVVMLSTDTEVEGTLRELLEPHTSRVFRLAYRQAQGFTKIEEGYFGE